MGPTRGVSVAMIRPGFNENLVVLERAECLRLLEGQGVGRVGCRVHGRPVIFPINYVVLDNAVLFLLGGAVTSTTALAMSM